jgi:hypothetical protein
MPETKSLWVPSPGDEVFLENGDLAQYIAPLDGRHVVRVVWEQDSDHEPSGAGPEYGELIMVPRVFEEVPVAQKNERIARLDREIEEKAKKLRVLQSDLSRAEQAGRQRLEMLKQHDGLQRLEDFLAGRITHFVVREYDSYPPVILEAKKALDNRESERDHPIKLLTLFGRTKGDLQWGINHYSEGSGSERFCYPCCSLEEAQALTSRLLEEIYAEARNRPGDRRGVLDYFDKVEAAAVAIGQKVPVDLVRAGLNAQFKSLQASWDKAQIQQEANLGLQRAIMNRLKELEVQDAD